MAHKHLHDLVHTYISHLIFYKSPTHIWHAKNPDALSRSTIGMDFILLFKSFPSPPTSHTPLLHLQKPLHLLVPFPCLTMLPHDPPCVDLNAVHPLESCRNQTSVSVSHITLIQSLPLNTY